MKKMFQPYHLVSISPWPIMSSFNLMFLMMGVMNLFLSKTMMMISFSMLSLVLSSMFWWQDISRESSNQGYHTNEVIKGLKMGMILFIISEIMFFISFFWSYFHMMLSPSMEMGNNWPPVGLMNMLINPYDLPLFNTMLLVSSGMFLTLSHMNLINQSKIKFIKWMYLTILFAIMFTMIQLIEYYNSLYSINTSVYGSTFFMMTGFHGIHVMIGTMFIMTQFIQILNMSKSNSHHLGFEASAWYWHFVDVVWLFLFLFVYWWPY